MSMSQWYQLSISSSAALFSSCLQSFPATGSFQMSWFLSIRWPNYWDFSFCISPSNIVQGWFPLGLTSLISLQSRGLERVFSRRKSEKHQFFCTQPSWWSNSHMLVGQWIIQIHILTVLWLHPYLWFCLDLGIYGLNKDEQNSVLTFKKGPL